MRWPPAVPGRPSTRTSRAPRACRSTSTSSKPPGKPRPSSRLARGASRGRARGKSRRRLDPRPRGPDGGTRPGRAGVNARTATGDLGSRGWIAEEPGPIKLVADADKAVLIGGTVVGSMGGEVLSAIVTAIHAEVPISTLANMHFAYPTFHRAPQPVLRELV
ncbi:hypothetical protein [Dactylosporangium sp. NPDC048998]|uniref:hypothetical protein n=1 Tax=Dactylosporangium sp. NPDC048998 TaxID=3363976 RepID=UPI00372279E0